jgi:predicted glycosyltransferase
MSEKPALLFYCQHSLGLGHLFRSLALCDALARRFRVVLLCGGKLPTTVGVPEGVEVIQLPPLGARTDGRLVSRDGRRSLDRAQRVRRDVILGTFRSLRPAIVVIEFFPFGKKRFEGELLPLLEEARGLGAAAPMIACSIRDILVSRGAEQRDHDDRAAGILNRYYDAVLVHSDPGFARLEDTFHPRLTLDVPVHYTGFVVQNGVSVHGHSRPSTRRREVIVSAGGGIVGEKLLQTAVQAHRLAGPEDGLRMKVLTGPFLPDDAWRSLRKEADRQTELVLRRSVPDLVSELRGSAASISQCGYNTALDILRARVPALVVPFGDGDEDEQTKRARRLQQLGAVRMIDAADLDPANLAEELRTLLRFHPRRLNVDMDGGRNAARLLAELQPVARRGARDGELEAS